MLHNKMVSFGNIIKNILGNLLDNTLGACRKFEKGKRSISLAVSYEKQMLSIVVCNTYGGELKRGSDGRFLTTKKDRNSHSLGLASVEQAVASNQGEFLTECAGGIYKAIVIMYGGRGKNDEQNRIFDVVE